MASGWPTEQIPNHPFIDLTLQLEISHSLKLDLQLCSFQELSFLFNSHQENEYWLTVLVSLALNIDGTLNFNVFYLSYDGKF